LTLSDTSLTIVKEEQCTSTWTRTNQKSRSIPLSQIIGCQLVDKRTKNETKKCRISILVKSVEEANNDSTNFKPIRFVFETQDGSEAVATLWKCEMMKVIVEVIKT
jgi:hypothetical protein